MDKKQFGRKLKKARKDRGLTSEKLAELCELSPVYLRQMETGGKIPSVPVLILLCKSLEVSPTYLLLESLETDSIRKMDILFELWHRATPQQIKIINALVISALELLDEQ